MFTRIIFEIKLFGNLELPKGYCDWNNCVSLHFLLSGNWKLQFPGTEEIGDKYLFSYTDTFLDVKECIFELLLVHNKYSNLPGSLT